MQRDLSVKHWMLLLLLQEVVQVPLPGLGSLTEASTATFTHELIIPDEYKSALQSALVVEQLDATPAPAPAGTAAAAAAAKEKPTKARIGLPKTPAASASAASKDSLSGAAVMRYKLRFSPLKALSCAVQLAVVRSTGGRWLYDVNLSVSL